jgi:hypothetical protein
MRTGGIGADAFQSFEGLGYLRLGRTPQIQDSVHGLLTWFLDIRSRMLDGEGDHRPSAMAAHLACCHRMWEPGVVPAEAPAVHTGGDFDPEAYAAEDRPFRLRVVALCAFIADRLRPFLSHAYLHGSLATRDYAAGWSDVDTLLVIRRSAVTDRAALLELRRCCLEAWPLFLQVCPLQHHGFIIATEDDLAAYPSHYLPPAVLESALTVIADGPLRLVPRSEQAGARRSLMERRDAVRDAVREGTLKHHPRNGVCLQSGYRNADDGMQQLFSLLGYLMTVPAYVLDALGRACHKRDSFVRARPILSPASWSIIDRISSVRAEWPQREGVAYNGNRIPDWVQNRLGAAYFEDALQVLEDALTVTA